MPAHLGDGLTFPSELFKDDGVVEFYLVDHLGGIDPSCHGVKQGNDKTNECGPPGHGDHPGPLEKNLRRLIFHTCSFPRRIGTGWREK